MAFAAFVKLAIVWAVLCIQLVWTQSRHNQYASILQDTRNEPTPDGHFGYLYKTEDGIVSSARGDPSGVIHGTFSYTDPTGLRVNYNYNAGSRFTPGLNYHKPAAAPARAGVPAPKARYQEPDYEDDGQYREQPEEQYVEPAPQYRPRGRTTYREPVDVYQERRSRPPPGGNDLYEDYRA
ncbi:uncharacterized protein LOC108907891 [Anoplophora glabripennis]|uniref:uncharacterized protein LOC108907891 n=1 Tax=Anoplophora glabripennis TaxID=217634 RepID=UPI000874168E|nr:uncharacterized protein LOC108907891 [Anoplophora glabripennis]